MTSQLDVLFVHPNAANKIYQDLSKDYSAKEPPIWASLLANGVRAKGYSVKILDCEALNLSPIEAANKIIEYDPILVVVVVYGQQPSASTQNMVGARKLIDEIDHLNYYEGANITVMMIGGHISALPQETLDTYCLDCVVKGEGLDSILAWLKNRNINIRIYTENIIPQEELNAKLPGMAWDLLPMDKYRTSNWHGWTNKGIRAPFASLYTSLGCPFSCLRGDTLINTIYGNIPIKELSEKYKTIPVYTYDRKSGEVSIRDGVEIKKYGSNKELVRVNFDDGTHIDCTPDHKFLIFTVKNQYKDSEELEIEAKDLKPKMSVRAVKEETNGYDKRIAIRWKRRDRQLRSRLVMEYLLGRKLTTKEQVHHKDHNKQNDHPDNLQYCSNAKEHISQHPEVSDRMKVDNPVKYLTVEKRLQGILKLRGKKSTLEQRIKYSESKKGSLIPNWKGGHSRSKYNISRLTKEVNHKIVSIETLLEKD